MSSRRNRLGALVAAAALVLGAGLVATPPATAATPNPTLTDAFDVSGSSSIGSIKATLPITPTTLTETLDLVTLKILSGTLPIASQQIQFKALGILPVKATVSLTQASPITGSLTALDDIGDLSLSAKTSYSIRISNVYAQIFGVWTPLFVGNHCQTITPSAISLSTPAGGSFNLGDGGTVTGKYSIGLFAGCTAFFVPGFGSLALDALVPGSNNTISVNITNPQYVSST